MFRPERLDAAGVRIQAERLVPIFYIDRILRVSCSSRIIWY